MIKITNKQIMLLMTIRNGNPDGTACSVYDLMERLPYKANRDAIRHSIKILIDNGYVVSKGRENRDGKSVQLFNVTTKTSEIL